MGQRRARGDETHEVGVEHLPLFDQRDPDPPAAQHRDARPTEAKAAEKMTPRVGSLRRKIYDRILLAGPRGMTGDELCDAFPSVTPYSLRPRLTELAQAGYLLSAGERENSRGNPETVFVGVRK